MEEGCQIVEDPRFSAAVSNASGTGAGLTLLFSILLISLRSRRVCSHIVGENHSDFPQVCVFGAVCLCLKRLIPFSPCVHGLF